MTLSTMVAMMASLWDGVIIQVVHIHYTFSGILFAQSLNHNMTGYPQQIHNFDISEFYLSILVGLYLHKDSCCKLDDIYP